MRALFVAAVLTAASCACSAAWCDSPFDIRYNAQVTGVIISGPGMINWAYEVENTSIDPAFKIWILAIGVNEECSVALASSPAGWNVDTSAGHMITWMATNAEVLPGQTLAGFTAAFNCIPTAHKWVVTFENESTGEQPNLEGSLPEPGGLTALLVGFIPFAAVIQRRRS